MNTDNPSQQLPKWEYLLEYDDNTGFSSKIKINGVKYDKEVDYLNERGNQGWELVQGQSYGHYAYTFKRPKP